MISDVAHGPRLTRYLYDREYESLEGWLHDGAAWSTFALSQFQRRHGITGDVAEIGVHHGKFFCLLALLTGDDERAIAMDVFDDQSLNVDQSGCGSRERLVSNYERFVGDKKKLIVHACDSLTLHGRDIFHPRCKQTKSVPQRARLFSVDGCHTAHHTRSDIEVAAACLAPGGVIIVDDFYNPYWPGVQEGVHTLLPTRPDLRAVAYHDNKLFLVKAEDHGRYYDFFVDLASRFAADYKLVELHDQKAITCHIADPRMSIDRDFRPKRARFFFGASRDIELKSGWGPSDTFGTWVGSTKATAAVDVPDALRTPEPLTVTLSVAPFLHPGQPARRMELVTNATGKIDGSITHETDVKLTIDDPSRLKTLELEFLGDRPSRPADHLPGDSRQDPISVFIRSITFERDTSTSA